MIFLINNKRIFKVILWVGLMFQTMILSAQPYFQTQLSDFVSPAPLDLRVGQLGDIQIWRNGEAKGQLFNEDLAWGNGACGTCWNMYNGVFLLVGNYLTVSYNGKLAGYDDIFSGGVSGVSGLGTDASPWEISVNYASLITAGYELNMVYSYVNGNEYIDVSIIPVIPATNTDTVKVFHIMDTYLSGSDQGPAYVEGTEPYDLMGVSNPDSTLYEAFVVTENPWDRYCSHHYEDALNEPFNDGQLSNTTNTISTTDNAIGVQWTLGTVSGIQPAIKYRIGFASSASAISGSTCQPAWLNRHVGRIINGG